MINNPQVSLASLEIAAETPFASLTVLVGGDPGSDAISIAPPNPSQGPASLLDAAQEAPPETPAPMASTVGDPAGLGGSTFAATRTPQPGFYANASGGTSSAGGTAFRGSTASNGGTFSGGAAAPLAGSGISANAQLGASFAARSLASTIATFASQNAGSPAASLLSNGALARVLVAAALGQAAPPGLSHGAAVVLTQAAALLRAANAAASPAAVTVLLDDLATLVSKDARELAAAASSLAPQTAQAPAGIILPQWDPSARLGRADRKKGAPIAEAHRRADERDRPIALPDRDALGRRYNERERLRLAQLAADPRRGYAPEGRVALAAELEHGVRLERSYDTGYDFADATGGRWNVSVPRSISEFESTLASARATTHTIVSAADLDAGDRAALAALVERSSARAGCGRLLIVDGGER